MTQPRLIAGKPPPAEEPLILSHITQYRLLNGFIPKFLEHGFACGQASILGSKDDEVDSVESGRLPTLRRVGKAVIIRTTYTGRTR